MIDADVPYDVQLRRRAAAIATICVHAGDAPDDEGSLERIVLSSAFRFDGADEAAAAFAGKNDARIYGRWGNPTVDALEAKLAALEGTEAACATASGMTAIAGVVLSVCAQGSHVVAPRSMYGESARLLRERLPRFGITTTFVDARDPEAYAAAITGQTALIYVETPSNPRLDVSDVPAIAAIARARSIPLLADNTFATPFGQTPFALGADYVVHSTTKGLGGHGDAIGGAVCGRAADIARVRDFVVKGIGGILSPFAAFLVARGVRTLAVRQAQACATAADLAARLAAHPAVARVHHPSLPGHPGHARARAQMHAYGALLSFEIADRPEKSAIDRGRAALDGVRTFTHAVSLGDARSLLVHPATTTHSTMPAEARRAAGIDDGLLRASIGLESADDLWRDLERVLA